MFRVVILVVVSLENRMPNNFTIVNFGHPQLWTTGQKHCYSKIQGLDFPVVVCCLWQCDSKQHSEDEKQQLGYIGPAGSQSGFKKCQSKTTIPKFLPVFSYLSTSNPHTNYIQKPIVSKGQCTLQLCPRKWCV